MENNKKGGIETTKHTRIGKNSLYFVLGFFAGGPLGIAIIAGPAFLFSAIFGGVLFIFAQGNWSLLHTIVATTLSFMPGIILYYFAYRYALKHIHPYFAYAATALVFLFGIGVFAS